MRTSGAMRMTDDENSGGTAAAGFVDSAARGDRERMHVACGLRSRTRDAQCIAGGGAEDTLGHVRAAGVSRAEDKDERGHENDECRMTNDENSVRSAAAAITDAAAGRHGEQRAEHGCGEVNPQVFEVAAHERGGE